MRKALLSVAVSILGIAVACGGSGNSTTPPPVVLRAIQVAPASQTIDAGQSEQLKATGSFSDGSTKDLTASVSWSSSQTSVATVAVGGALSTKTAGTTSITATLNSVTGSFNLTVSPAALVSIAVTSQLGSIAFGTTDQFVATGTFTDNSTQNITSSASWNSSDPTVATISSGVAIGGLAKGVSAGSVTITATSGSISGSAMLIVINSPVISLAVSGNPSLPFGLGQQFTATATFEGGSTQDVSNVSAWVSSAPSVVSITTSGFGIAKQAGTSTINATFQQGSNSVSAGMPVSVDYSDVSSVSIQPASATIAQGTNVAFEAVATLSNGSTQTVTGLVTWSLTSNSASATVQADGVAFGGQAGSATVEATLPASSTSAAISAAPASLIVTDGIIQSLTVAPSGSTIPIGGHARLTATGTFKDSSGQITTQDITSRSTWTPDPNNPSVATVGNQSGSFGLVTGDANGTANISASFSYANATATGTAPVNVSSATLTSITVSPSQSLLVPGSGLQFQATGTFSDASTQNIGPFATWSSSDSAVASVSTRGFVTAESAGTASITAQSGSITSQPASVVVESFPLKSITVSASSGTVPEGIQLLFTAIGTFADNSTQNLSSSVIWTSSAPAVATISNAQASSGVAIGVAPGNTNITAAFGTIVSAPTALTVNTANLISITVNPPNSTINLGQSQQFSAVGTFSDASGHRLTLDISRQVNWSSNVVSVATISATGFASSASRGSTTVQATLDGITGSTTLTVQ